jgi:hypothetical protein
MFDTTKSKDDTRGQGQTRAIGPVNGRVISGDTWCGKVHSFRRKSREDTSLNSDTAQADTDAGRQGGLNPSSLFIADIIPRRAGQRILSQARFEIPPSRLARGCTESRGQLYDLRVSGHRATLGEDQE